MCKKYYIGILICGFIFTNCAYYSKMAIPEIPSEKDKYKVLGHVTKSATGFRFLTLGNVPSAMGLVKKAIRQKGGDGIVDFEVTFSECSFLIFSFPQVTISGDVVKNLSNDTVVSFLSSDTIEQKINKVEQKINKNEAEREKIIQETEKTKQTSESMIQDWKSEILKQYRRSYYGDEWRKHLRKTGKEIDKNEWVEKLTEKDYDNYLNSGLKVGQWMVKKWKEAEHK